MFLFLPEKQTINADLKINIGFEIKDGDETCTYNVSLFAEFSDSSIAVDQSEWNFVVFGKADNNTQRLDRKRKH